MSTYSGFHHQLLLLDFSDHAIENLVQLPRRVDGQSVVTEAVLELLLLPKAEQIAFATNGEVKRKSEQNSHPRGPRRICNRENWHRELH